MRARASSALLALLALLAIGAAAACSGERPSSPSAGPTNVAATLGGDLVARVGDVPIHRSLVLAVARARGISATEALHLLVDEALLAHAAEKSGVYTDVAVRKNTAATLSRAILAPLRAQALASGPWTDQEIADAIGPRWIELDRPETRAVIHALVKKDVPGGAAIAEKLRGELVTATGTDAASSKRSFEERAKAFAMPAGTALVVEDIPAITADGRIASPEGAAVGQRVVPAFAKGAFAVAKELGTSDVIESDFGFHVVRVLQIHPPQTASREEKVRESQPQLIGMRAKPLHDALVERLRREANPLELATPDDLGRPR